MDRLKALDLFCGAGGVSMGLHRAGFDVTGVDIEPQPSYPFPFIRADVMALDPRGFDFIWASPPCQAHTNMSNRWRGKGSKADTHVDLIGRVREKLISAGSAWALENVPGAASVMRSPIRLTGEMFGLRVHRPRLFETNFLVLTPTPPRRQGDPVPVYGKMDGRRLWSRSDGTELRAPRSLEGPAAAMGIDWMTWDEIREAIPPAYAQFIGEAALRYIGAAAA